MEEDTPYTRELFITFSKSRLLDYIEGQAEQAGRLQTRFRGLSLIRELVNKSIVHAGQRVRVFCVDYIFWERAPFGYYCGCHYNAN